MFRFCTALIAAALLAWTGSSLATSPWSITTVDPSGGPVHATVGPDGSVHIAYVATRTGPEYHVRVAKLGAGGWSFDWVEDPATWQAWQAFGPNTALPRPSIEIDAQGEPLVAFASASGAATGVKVAARSNGVWSTDVLRTWGWRVDLALDPAGMPHASYQDLGDSPAVQRHDGIGWSPLPVGTVQELNYLSPIGFDGGGSPFLLYAKPIDGFMWDPLHPTDPLVTLDPERASGVGLFTDTSGGHHLAYGTSAGLLYATLDGTTLDAEVAVADHSLTGVPSSIVLDGSGEPVIAYIRRYFVFDPTFQLFMDLHFARRSGGSWSEELVLEDAGHAPALAYDGEGTLHLFYCRNWGQPLYHARLEASTSAPHALGRTNLRMSRPQPNPFNPSTAIRFSLERDTTLRLRVIGLDGRVVSTLVEAPHSAGEHVVHWDGRDAVGQSVASGVYFAELRGGGERVTTRLTLIK